MPTYVKGLLDVKGRQVVTARPDVTILEAAKILHEQRIGAVVITGDSGEVLGIFSERDLVRAIAKSGPDGLGERVSTMMTANVTRCHETTTVDEIMEVMTAGRFRHVPVEDETRILVGIISIGDVVKSRIGEIEAEAEHIKAYIAG